MGCGCDLPRNAVRDAVEPPFVFWVSSFVHVSLAPLLILVWAFWLAHCWCLRGLWCRTWHAFSSVSLSVAPLAAFHGKSVHVSSAFEEVFSFLACVPLFLRTLGSCHPAAVVASHG